MFLSNPGVFLRVVSFVGAILSLAALSHAQVVTYRFTGTAISASAGMGDTVSGTVTLDVGAIPDLFGNFPDGQFAQWLNGNFSVNAQTSTGFSVGSSLGGSTFFDAEDNTTIPRVSYSIENLRTTAEFQRGVRIIGRSNRLEDGIVEVPNRWVPQAEAESFIYVSDYDFGIELFTFGMYRIDTFELANIVIQGVDTGIQDFEFNGNSFSSQIDRLIQSAANRGARISSVTTLTNQAREAGLLTNAQRATILNIVRQIN
jgi:hypothetical protein